MYVANPNLVWGTAERNGHKIPQVGLNRAPQWLPVPWAAPLIPTWHMEHREAQHTENRERAEGFWGQLRRFLVTAQGIQTGPFRCSHFHLLKRHSRNTSCREGIESVENDRNLGSSRRPGMSELMEIWGTVRRKSMALIKPSCVTYTPLEFLWDGLCTL